MTEEPEFAKAMRAASTKLRAEAVRLEGRPIAELCLDHATLCEVWREIAEQLSADRQNDFRKLTTQWLDEAKSCG